MQDNRDRGSKGTNRQAYVRLLAGFSSIALLFTIVKMSILGERGSKDVSWVAEFAVRWISLTVILVAGFLLFNWLRSRGGKDEQ